MAERARSATSGGTLDRLAGVLEQRRGADPESSYVAGLYRRGRGAVLDKIEEESAELVAAARTGERAAIVHEAADLWFHTLVLLAHENLHPGDVMAELERRFGTSGLDEKAARGKAP